MKVAIYARVSMEEVDKKADRYQDPMNQIAPLERWAKDMGWEVYYIYVDRGSGANPARKEWRKLMNDAQLRKFNCVLVWKIDRFSRESIGQQFAYLEKLHRRGISFKSLTEGWMDTSNDNPMREIIFAIMAWASAEERRKISQRTKAGIQRRKNIGVWKGGRPPICQKCKKPTRGRKKPLCICTTPRLSAKAQKGQIPKKAEPKAQETKGGMPFVRELEGGQPNAQ